MMDRGWSRRFTQVGFSFLSGVEGATHSLSLPLTDCTIRSFGVWDMTVRFTENVVIIILTNGWKVKGMDVFCSSHSFNIPTRVI